MNGHVLYIKQISLGWTTTCKKSRVDNFNGASVVSVYNRSIKKKHPVFHQTRNLKGCVTAPLVNKILFVSVNSK